MFVLRKLGLAIGVLLAAVTSQLPEFAQQYRQRLGGAIDEINRMLAEFDQDAASNKMTRAQGIETLRKNPEKLVSQRGARIAQSEERASRLDGQRKSFEQAGSFGRLAVFLRDFDSGVAGRAMDVFEPAMPLTLEGVTSAVIGFFAGLGIWRLILWPLNRRRRTSAEAKQGAAA